MKGKVLLASVVAASMMLAAPAAATELTLQVGFENSISEPIGQALENCCRKKW